jgi:hypothetical protein
MSVATTNPIAARVRAYRRRQVAAGNREVTLHLPGEAVSYLDHLKQRHGLQNRSQALLQLIKQGRDAAQQMT